MKEQRMQKNFLISGLRLISVMAVVAFVIAATSLIGWAASGTVKSSNVNVRSEASATSTAVATVTTNDVVTIVSETTGADGLLWYSITTAGGVSGYIRSDFVTKSAEAVQSTTTVTPTDSKTAYVAGTSGVRIRKDASTSSDLVATATGGTQLTITGEATAADGYKWYQITFTGNGTTMNGFIRSDLVTFTAPVQTPETTVIAGTMEEPSETVPEDVAPTEEPVPLPEENTPDVPTESASAGELSILSPIEPPEFLPAGFQEFELNLDGRKVAAWYRGDFYILYAMKSDGTEGWFLYDSQTRTYLRCEGLFGAEDTQEESNQKSGGLNFTIVSIVLGVLLLAAIAVIAFLGYKLANIEYEYDDDDDDDDDEVVQAPVRERKVIQPENRPQRRVEEEPEERIENRTAEKSSKKSSNEKKGFGRKFIDYFTEEVEDDDDDDDDDDIKNSGEDIDYIDF